jgi:predicted amidohydrolase YtcJ
LSFILIACRDTSKVDLIIFNAAIYTVDSAFSKAQAIAVRDGKIEAIGNSQDITGQCIMQIQK